MTSSQTSERYGERLLPHIIDERANAGYPRPFAMFSKTRDPSEGFETVSYQRLANAVNRVCWWLDTELAEAEEKQNAFAYFGPNDLRYVIFFFATMKAGRKILIASHRNTVEAHLSLFEKVRCRSIISCSSQDQIMQHVYNAVESAVPHIRKIHAPTIDSILVEDPVAHYPYNMTFETDPSHFIATLHTSGTSGNPKPIGWNKLFLTKMDLGNDLPIHQGMPLIKTTLWHENALCLLPCFHAGGLAYNMFAVLFEMTLVFGHPDIPTTAEYVAQLLKPGVITSILAPPSILEDLTKLPSALQDLAKLSQVAYGGGPIRPEIGRTLSGLLPHFFSFIGATEMGWHHTIVGGNEFWDSIRWYADIGYEFEEISDGIFEQVVINNERTNRYQGIFEVFPKLTKYRTRDLYSPHPTAPGWWKYRGRADDLIILSNGEKINPIPMENVIRSNPLVKSALVVGEYRFNPSLLIEIESENIPKTDAQRLETLHKIWPTVEEANRIAPGFAKVPKSLILFATYGKPFLRAGKGTVQRQLTVKAYSKELDHLFLSQQNDLLIEGLTLGQSCSPASIKTFIREIYRQALEADDLNDSDDVFNRGMDSLKVLIVVQRVRAAAKASEMWINFEDINARLIYSAPSVDKMTKAILGLVGNTNGIERIQKAPPLSREQKMKDLVEKYSGGLTSPVSAGKSAEVWNVLLTGTTGSLGTYLLAALENMPSVKVGKIFCLNRSPNSKERQKKSSAARGLNAAFSDKRVEFLQADLSQRDLGLGAEKFSELLGETTVIIHNAWQVNFNLALDTFEPQIRGVRNLLDFSAQSAQKAPLIFVSSISTAHGWLEMHPGEVVPEAVLDDFDAPEQMGYSESKFVCEHLVQAFSKISGVTTAIMRTGQIAGPLKGSGVWNRHEWFPSIMTSSKHLGHLPETLGYLDVVDWIPVDVLASIIVELMNNTIRQDGMPTRVYNLVNPRSTTWSALGPQVQKIAGIERMAPLRDWLEALEQSSHEKEGAVVDTSPALKLLDFMRILSQKSSPPKAKSMFEVKGLIRDSQGAAQLTEVTPKWIELWMKQWSL